MRYALLFSFDLRYESDNYMYVYTVVFSDNIYNSYGFCLMLQEKTFITIFNMMSTYKC